MSTSTAWDDAAPPPPSNAIPLPEHPAYAGGDIEHPDPLANEVETAQFANAIAGYTKVALKQAGLHEHRDRDEVAERQLLWRLVTQPDDQIFIADEARDELFSQPIRQELLKLLREMEFHNQLISPDSVNERIERENNVTLKAMLQQEFIRCIQTPTARPAPELIITLGKTFRARSIQQLIFREASTRFDQGEDIDKLIGSLENILIDLSRQAKRRPKFSDVVRKVLLQIKDPDKSRGGLQIGLRDFDRQFGGIKRDRVMTIAGYTGSGKTALVIDLLYRLLYHHKERVAIKFWTLEMSEERIVQRLISRIARVSVKRQDDWWVKVAYRDDDTGQEIEEQLMDPLTPDELSRVEKAAAFLEQMDGVIDVEYAALSVEDMERSARQWRLQNKDKHLIYILDHIGLVKKDGSNNRTEFDNIMNACKDIARTSDATVIPLVQLSKSVESRYNKDEYFRPSSADIMESVGVEAASDIVLLLWRPHKHFAAIPYIHPDLNIYSDIKSKEPEDWWDCRHRMILVVAKNRDGNAHNDMVFDADMAHSHLYQYGILRKINPRLFSSSGQLEMPLLGELDDELEPPAQQPVSTTEYDIAMQRYQRGEALSPPPEEWRNAPPVQDEKEPLPF